MELSRDIVCDWVFDSRAADREGLANRIGLVSRRGVCGEAENEEDKEDEGKGRRVALPSSLVGGKVSERDDDGWEGATSELSKSLEVGDSDPNSRKKVDLGGEFMS